MPQHPRTDNVGYVTRLLHHFLFHHLSPYVCDETSGFVFINVAIAIVHSICELM